MVARPTVAHTGGYLFITHASALCVVHSVAVSHARMIRVRVTVKLCFGTFRRGRGSGAWPRPICMPHVVYRTLNVARRCVRCAGDRSVSPRQAAVAVCRRTATPNRHHRDVIRSAVAALYVQRTGSLAAKGRGKDARGLLLVPRARSHLRVRRKCGASLPLAPTHYTNRHTRAHPHGHRHRHMPVRPRTTRICRTRVCTTRYAQHAY